MPVAYEDVAARFGGALARLARATESDPDRRADLLQEMHVALWRSLPAFEGRCSERTWALRVAHNVAASHVRAARRSPPSVSLDAVDPAAEDRLHEQLERKQGLARAHALIGELPPLDRQVVLLYLEGLEAAEIAEIAGLTPANVAQKIHRAKALLARRMIGGTP